MLRARLLPKRGRNLLIGMMIQIMRRIHKKGRNANLPRLKGPRKLVGVGPKMSLRCPESIVQMQARKLTSKQERT